MELESKQNMVYVSIQNEDVTTGKFDEAYDLVDENSKRLPKVEKYEEKVMLWGIDNR
ncbi:hypothetical protein [Salinibacter grassmerensis]|uniref:hypothetical protein n=1 Tax=Salinibacter grassmerensis TaxID=3040353 RepID=UPI0021E7FE02|nr:hypothetical protein [Salinibacter grassmerensis]